MASTKRKTAAPPRKPPARRRPPPRRSSTSPVVKWIAGIAVLGIGAALVLSLALGKSSGSSQGAALSVPAGCTADTQSDPGRSHVASPTYQVNPPAGGDHFPTPASAGLYTSGPVPTDGELVHSLEHGYVILWYNPSLSSTDLGNLVSAAQQFPIDTLVVPRPGMPVPVAATAWHHRLLCQHVNTAEVAAFSAFIDQWRNKGPEQIPH